MSDLLYSKFVKRWEEVMDVPPQNLGPFTPYYKMLTKRLKVMPWPALFIVAFVTVCIIYVFIGSTVTFVVTLLQRGF